MDDTELNKRIQELNNDNRIIQEWQQNANQIINLLVNKVNEQEKRLKEAEENNIRLQYELLVCKGRIDSLPYDILDPGLKLPICKPNILSVEDTIDLLTNGKKSMSRFGDGEFGLIGGIQRWRFQSNNSKLGSRLKEVLQSSEDGFLVALNPDFYKNFILLPDDDIMGVMAYMTHSARKQHAELLDDKKYYANALCFRNLKTIKDFIILSLLWKDRKCLFIEGRHTGLGVGNSLFSACSSIQRIICPAENAWDKYDEILDAALTFDKNTLILIALGPTASVLSYDLYKSGYQAIDVGMLDLQYEAVLRGKDISQVSLENKCCSEDIIYGDRVIEEIKDPVYQSQIYCTIL